MSEAIVKPIEAIIAETRQEIQPYVFKRLEARTPRKAGQKIARTITVTSGKGGVGKTSLVVNMAICLSQAGQKVIVLDADLGLANIDVVFGVRPTYSLIDVLNGEKNIDEIMVQGPRGVQIIAGGSGVRELANIESEKSERLFAQLRFLEDKADFLLIDTGAGISDSVLSFCRAADQVVVITNTEPTSLTDAYGIIKVLSTQSPESKVSVLVNRVEEDEEGIHVYDRLSKVAKDFLNFDIKFMGTLPQDRNMHIAIRQQTPLMVFSPMSPAATELRKIVSKTIFEIPETFTDQNQTGFFDKVAQFFKGGSRK
ncbi:MAG: Flagellum site-determining protein YlxH [bacterium ADurb.Bin157]|jgi:flagellar biosynthesis protein FlhG|nr:MinD/ParA family protein [bacterium]OQB48456.1 MAG: Flagellum site-determining protein YlxH [bacterium ADurb.Bin157]